MLHYYPGNPKFLQISRHPMLGFERSEVAWIGKIQNGVSEIRELAVGIGSRPMPEIPERCWEFRIPEYRKRKLKKLDDYGKNKTRKSRFTERITRNFQNALTPITCPIPTCIQSDRLWNFHADMYHTDRTVGIEPKFSDFCKKYIHVRVGHVMVTS